MESGNLCFPAGCGDDIVLPHAPRVKSSQNGLTFNSAAPVFQLVALSEDRFVRKIGRCLVEDMKAIRVLLKDLLSLE